MRNCSKTDLQVIKVCQKLHLARVTQEKIPHFRKVQGFVNCIVLHCPSTLIIPHGTKDRYASGHIPGIADM